MHYRISLILSDTARNTVKDPLRIARVITRRRHMGAVRGEFVFTVFLHIVTFVLTWDRLHYSTESGVFYQYARIMLYTIIIDVNNFIKFVILSFQGSRSSSFGAGSRIGTSRVPF